DPPVPGRRPPSVASVRASAVESGRGAAPAVRPAATGRRATGRAPTTLDRHRRLGVAHVFRTAAEQRVDATGGRGRDRSGRGGFGRRGPGFVATGFGGLGTGRGLAGPGRAAGCLGGNGGLRFGRDGGGDG